MAYVCNGVFLRYVFWIMYAMYGIYSSSQDAARDLELLRKHGITHVVNAATAIANFYPEHFTYLAISILDIPTQNLRQHFEEVLLFMRGAIERGGKVSHL